jgi:hypothetical protein
VILILSVSRYLREGPSEDHPMSPGKKLFLDFIVLNKRSIETIVKSKILDHLVIPMKNAR